VLSGRAVVVVRWRWLDRRVRVLEHSGVANVKTKPFSREEDPDRQQQSSVSICIDGWYWAVGPVQAVFVAEIDDVTHFPTAVT
jgi:hypothetical protein